MGHGSIFCENNLICPWYLCMIVYGLVHYLQDARPLSVTAGAHRYVHWSTSVQEKSVKQELLVLCAVRMSECDWSKWTSPFAFSTLQHHNCCTFNTMSVFIEDLNVWCFLSMSEWPEICSHQTLRPSTYVERREWLSSTACSCAANSEINFVILYDALFRWVVIVPEAGSPGG